MTRRAAIYARISRDRIGAGLGVDRQTRDCRQLAGQLGWRIVVEYADNDLSAYSGKPRPGYLSLLDDLHAGRVDAVLTWHTDRLHRSPVELEDFISVCEPRNAPTHTVKAGPIDLATPAGRMVARQLGAVARYEVEHQIERQKRAKQQAAEAGRFRGGRRAFGYERDGVTVIDAEKELVADWCDRVLAGESLNSIAQALNRDGVLTSTGSAWSSTALRRVLMRARNFGRIEQCGQILEGVDAAWEPLIDEDVGRGVRTLLSDPSRLRAPKSADRVWLGAGVYLCGVCADGTTVRSGGTVGDGRTAYRCRGPRAHLTRVAEPVDQLVTRIVLERLSRPDAALLLDDDAREDPTGLRSRSAALRVRLDELAGLFAAGDVTASQLAEGSRRIRTELGELDTRLAAAVARSPLAGFADAADVGAAWWAASVSRRKAVVRALVVVTLLSAPRGRRPGGSYFDEESVRFDWNRRPVTLGGGFR